MCVDVLLGVLGVDVIFDQLRNEIGRLTMLASSSSSDAGRHVDGMLLEASRDCFWPTDILQSSL